MSTVSSPTPQPDSAPPAAPSFGAATSKVPFKDSVWRPIASCGGALAIGLLLSPFFIRPVKTVENTNALPEVILPRETTMIVTPSAPPGALLLGQIKLVADVTGKTSVAGSVARHVVETGTHVKKGDPVAEVTTGESERPAPAAETLQNKAEKSQIAASDAQNLVAQKISIAQTKLRAAQDRVNAAQAQVGTARDIVRRMQNGEKVSSAEIPAPFRTGAPVVRVTPRHVAQPVPAANRAGEIALQQAQAAKDAAKEGASDLKAARQMLSDARDAASTATDKLKTATKNVADVEARFDDKKATGADVELARSDQRDAQTAVTSTAKVVDSAVAEVAKRQKAADAMQSYAEKAANDAKAAMKDVKLFASNPAPTETPAATNSDKPTLQQAVQFASAALRESQSASRDADKLNAEIDGYKHQVSTSTERVEDASKSLATAQQHVLDSVPKVNFVPVLAPAEGVVTWIATLAREVKSGQSVFGIAMGSKVGARFEDKSDLWRGLKVGSVLSAIASPDSKSASATDVPASAPALIRVTVTEVDQPAAEGDSAVVEGDVTPASGSSASMSAGMSILASVARPGDKPTLNVPSSALVPVGSKFYLGVLKPGVGPEQKGGFHLAWQEVTVGRGDGLRREVLSGVVAGSRIVSEPENLEQQGFGPPAAPAAGVTGTTVPQEVSSDGILVRLTPTSA